MFGTNKKKLDKLFISLCEEHHKKVVKYLYYTIGDLEEANDLAQEVFTIVYKRIEELEKHENRAGFIYKTFTFFDKETTTFIKTSYQDIEDKEAERLAKEASKSYGKPQEPSGNVMELEQQTLRSIKEVKEQLNIDIAVPNYIPEGFEQEQSIYVETTEHEAIGRTDRVYITYRSSEDEGKHFGFTVIKEDMKEEVTSIVTTDAVYKDKYTNVYGDEYMLFDEDGGIIAQTTVGNIEYLLVFMGVSEDEIYKSIDSVDLSVYGK